MRYWKDDHRGDLLSQCIISGHTLSVSITGHVNLNHVVKVVSARIFH